MLIVLLYVTASAVVGCLCSVGNVELCVCTYVYVCMFGDRSCRNRGCAHVPRQYVHMEI